MKIGTRLLTLAGLLLMLPCLAAPHAPARRCSPTPPPTPVIDPVQTFDHDPMSITVEDNRRRFTAAPYSRHNRTLRSRRSRVRGYGRAVDQDLKYIPIEKSVFIIVHFEDTTSPSTSSKVAHLFFYRRFVKNDKFTRKLDYDKPPVQATPTTPAQPAVSRDYSILSQEASITNGVAVFKVTFHKSAIDKLMNDDESSPAYKKIYIVATILTGPYLETETKQYCFQTITVYDPAKVHHLLLRRNTSGYRKSYSSRAKGNR